MSESASERNRREFLQKALWLFASLPLAGAALSACTKTPNPSAGVQTSSNTLPPGDQPVKEEDPVAVSLGYKMNAANVDTEKFPKKKGPGGDKQNCKNCQFYTPKNDYWGSCQIIRTGVVNAGGWCNSWGPRPGTTT
jgi:hypothetical protein